MCARNYSKKGKDSSAPAALIPLRELPEPDNLARFQHTQATSTIYWSHHRTNPGNEQQIISGIKTIRKKN
jgi:hypothetical protein